MPVWLSLFLALLATAGFFATFYGLIFLVLDLRNRRAKPIVGLAPGDKEGALGFWVYWSSTAYIIQIYRIRVNYFSPESEVKEGNFSVTYDPPQKASFCQGIELPAEFKKILEANTGENAIVTVDARTVEGPVIAKDYRLSRVRKAYRGKASGVPDVMKLKTAPPDAPPVSSLDYPELVARKKKIKELEDQVKAKAAAKAAAAAAAPAAKPATPAVPAAPGAPAAPAPVASPKPVVPAPAKPAVVASTPVAPVPQDKPVQKG